MNINIGKKRESESSESSEENEQSSDEDSEERKRNIKKRSTEINLKLIEEISRLKGIPMNQ